MRHFAFTVVPALLAMSLGTAQAAVISRTYTFTAGGFVSLGGIQTPPVDTVAGSISIVFDNAVRYERETSGITGTINLLVGSQLSFGYNTRFDALIIGGSRGGSGGVSGQTNDFSFGIRNATTSPSAGELFYAQNGRGPFQATTATVTVLTVPEPAGAALFGASLAGLFWAHRRRRAIVPAVE